MYIKLSKSWNGKCAGSIIEVDAKHEKYIYENKIGVKTQKPSYKRKVKNPDYKTKAKSNDTSKDS